MKIKKLIETENVYGRDYTFHLTLDVDTWKNMDRVIEIIHRYQLETYKDDGDIIKANILDLN